jgi:predicted GNAT superfamily acetyltransferase
MSGLEMRDLHDLDEFAEAGALVRRVWGSTPERSPLNVQQLPAMAHAGCQISGGFEGNRMVAATMAFVGLENGTPILHSHVTGVDPDRQGAGVGLAMKWYQRRWCLDRGINVVTWTFDPLVAANGRFNLVRLKACGVQYLRNFYGVMDDALNRDDPTDRLVTRWSLDSPDVGAASQETGAASPSSATLLAAGAEFAVTVDDGAPAVRSSAADVRLLVLPEDIVALRVAGDPAVPVWRQAVRAALETALSDGHVVCPMTVEGHLVTHLPGALAS